MSLLYAFTKDNYLTSYGILRIRRYKSLRFWRGDGILEEMPWREDGL